MKPDPPESVSARHIEGFSTRLMVSWNFPSSWPLQHAFPLLFHIRYRPLGSMFWSEVSKQGLVQCRRPRGHMRRSSSALRDEGLLLSSPSMNCFKVEERGIFQLLLSRSPSRLRSCPSALLPGQSGGDLRRSGWTRSPGPGPSPR